MNKKTLRIAGWALGLSMAVAGIGAAVGASFVANESPLMVKAEENTATQTEAISTTSSAMGGNANVFIKTSSSNTYSNPLRIYANTTITITAQGDAKLTKVVYNASSTGNYVTYAKEAAVSPSVTPTVSSKAITWALDNVTEFTFKPSTQTRADSIVAYYIVEEPKNVVSVDVSTQPTKTSYKINEAFDPSGMEVTVNYDDSSSEVVAYDADNNASQFDFVGFDSSNSVTGQEITVKYTDDGENYFTCDTKVAINVIEVHANSMLVDATGMNRSYRTGQTLDLTGLSIIVGYDDNSDEAIEITSNDDFIAKGFSLKLSGITFDLSTALMAENDGASFIVYYGDLYDDTYLIDITVENVATISLSNPSTSGDNGFWSDGSNSYDSNRAGVVGNGTYYSAFHGKWYVGNNKFQMNELNKNSFIANSIQFGIIKTITVSANSANASYFSMYYGNAVNPSSNKITASVSSNTYTYDFSGKNATYFKFAKDVTKGSTQFTLTIDFVPNGSLNRTQAGAYADYFLATTNDLCDPDGVDNGVADVWDKLAGVYSLLSDTTKANLKAEAIARKGIENGTTIGNAMARYYWAAKNHDANADFIGDGDVTALAKNVAFEAQPEKANPTIAITIIAGTGLASAAGFAFLRRKKEDR